MSAKTPYLQAVATGREKVNPARFKARDPRLIAEFPLGPIEPGLDEDECRSWATLCRSYPCLTEVDRVRMTIACRLHAKLVAPDGLKISGQSLLLRISRELEASSREGRAAAAKRAEGAGGKPEWW
jgi:hypothetical protein